LQMRYKAENHMVVSHHIAPPQCMVLFLSEEIILILLLSFVLFFSSCRDEVLPPDEEILINKWHYDLMDDDYHCFAILVRAAMHDPATFELDSLVEKNQDNILFGISDVLKTKVRGIQSFPVYKDLPGSNPWGKTDKPVYRKSLPSEMKAAQKLVGKYAGDCSSISNLSTALCRINGITEDDVFILRTKEHSVGLIQYKSELYMFDNTWVERLDAIELLVLNRYKVTGFYNDRYYSKKSVFITKKGLSGTGTLKEKLESRYKIKFHDIHTYSPESIEYHTRIALQEKSTDVVDVINASVKGPLLKEICTEKSTIDDLVNWINLNIDSKQLFLYDAFMTPDQVIVFKTAGTLDKAVFLWCYCRIKNIPCELYLNKEVYCLRIDKRLFLIEEKISEAAISSTDTTQPGFISINTLSLK